MSHFNDSSVISQTHKEEISVYVRLLCSVLDGGHGHGAGGDAEVDPDPVKMLGLCSGSEVLSTHV